MTSVPLMYALLGDKPQGNIATGKTCFPCEYVNKVVKMGLSETLVSLTIKVMVHLYNEP